MKYLKLFENYDEVSQAQAQLAELDSLRDFAILTADEYSQQSSSLMKIITAHNRKLIKQSNLLHQPYSDEWYAELRQHPSMSWLIGIKESPEYSELIAAGLHPVSSPIQLGNRTFVFAKDPNYTSGSAYAIGFFSSINVVRRLTPNVTRHGRSMPTLDQKVKSFDGSMEPAQFFKAGMRWVLDNLDLTDSGFANNKTIASISAREDSVTKLYSQIIDIFAAGGTTITKDELLKLPIDGIRSGVTDLKKVTSTIKRNFQAKSKVIVPISPYQTYSQELVDQMVKYPNVTWTADNQLRVSARNVRGWNIEVPSELRSLMVKEPLAADALLRKFEADGVINIRFLRIPMGSIDGDDYPGIEVHSTEDSDRLRWDN
jgi:hypothetical protein